MLLYYNHAGQLLESLTYGEAARVGSNNFKIFAYFEGIDDYSKYEIAMIRFKRPDLSGSEYPILFMVQNSLYYDQSIEKSKYFKEANNPYQGFLFDFSTIISNSEPVILLDTPGMWEASITLISTDSNLRNVIGLCRFYVEGAVSCADDEPEILDISDMMSNIATILNDYALKNKTITVVADITATNIANDDVGRIYLSKSDGMLYQKVGLGNEYEPFYIFSNIFVAGETTTFKEIADIRKPVFVEYGGHYYLFSSIEPGPGYYVFTIFELLTAGKLFTSRNESVAIADNVLFSTIVSNNSNPYSYTLLEQKSTINTIYGINSSGQQVQLSYSDLVLYNAIVKRTATGQIKVPSKPSESNDAASKGYVDDIITISSSSGTITGDDIAKLNNPNIRIYNSQKDVYYERAYIESGYIYFVSSKLLKGTISNYSYSEKEFVAINPNANPITFAVGTMQFNFYDKSQADTLLDGKVDKIASGLQPQDIVAYVAKNVSGTYSDDKIQISTSQNGYTIPRRTADGNLRTVTPTNGNDAATKDYVDAFGYTIEVSIDSSTYVITITLKDKNGNVCGTAQSIDLPLESVVVDGSYDDNTQSIILTLESGSTITIPVGHLVAGLVATGDITITGGYVSTIKINNVNYPVAQNVTLYTTPKEVATTGDLPAENDGYLYLVLADGYLYYWDATEEDWVQGYEYVQNVNALVPKTRTIAGIDLADDITEDELNAALTDNSFSTTSDNPVKNKVVSKFVSLFNGETEYSNLFNPTTILPNTDLSSTTGEPIANNNLDSSDFIEVDATQTLTIKGNAVGSMFFYCYDDSKTFLGYIQIGGSDTGTTISNTYPLTKYVKIVMPHANVNTTYVIYVKHLSQTYVPYSPIDGNLEKSNFFNHWMNKFVEFGYIYYKGWIEIDASVSPATFKIQTSHSSVYILGNRGFGKNTSITKNTSYALTNYNPNSCGTIVYDKTNDSIICIQDYTGDYNKYIILGYYDHGEIFGNMGMILLNGKVAKPEILRAVQSSGQEGYFYNKGYMDIDTTTNPVTFKIMTNSYVLGSKGFGKNTGIVLNTPIELVGYNLVTANGYGTIVYQISTNTFKIIQDYKGDYSDYIIFGYIDHGYIFGNMGMILLNGQVSNQELEKLLEDYDIGDLSSLQQQVNNNSTAIGVNAGNISSEAGARASADAALGARIDNLVAPSGSSVAEITDARVGYDGTIYASLEARLNGEEGKTVKRIGNILTVGVGKMYQTIGAAVSAAQNNDIIFISKGVYEEYVYNLDKCVHIIGESKNEVIWKYPNTTYGRSPYECGMGSIRNLTIHAYDNGTPSDNRSYCVHLDHFSHYQDNPPVSNYFYCENVHMINDSNEAIGIGLRPNLTVEFVNCTFECLSGDEASFYVHSSTSATTTNAKCILKNCTIINNDHAGEKGALRVEGYAVTDGGSTAIFQGNIIVNRGGGPAFLLQNRTIHYTSWSQQDDWVLDVTSQLNNIDNINYGSGSD